ncbi:hypothetical protein [Virgibacillus dokdonensis]|nr:hypothetical protein [Virgibacillus dokdonensis]
MRAHDKNKRVSFKPTVKVLTPKEKNKPRKSKGCCGRGNVKAE